MAYDAILDTEIEVDDALTQSLMQKIKDNDEYLYGKVGSLASAGIDNGSFEVAGDTTAEASGWTLTNYPGGTVVRDTAANAHGTACMKMVHPGGAGNGGGHSTSDYMPCFEGTYDLSFLTWSTVQGLSNLAQIFFYDEDKVYQTVISPWVATGGQPSTKTPVGTTFTVPSGTRFLRVRVYGGATAVDVAGTAYFDDVVVVPNTPTALAVAANSEDIAIATATTSSTSYVAIGSDTIDLDVIDGGGGSTEIKFTAHASANNYTTYMRFRVGATYSNEITEVLNTLQSHAMTLTLDGLTNASITIYMEVKNSAGVLAYAKVDAADTTVELV